MSNLNEILGKLKTFGKEKVKHKKVLIEFVDRIRWQQLEELITSEIIGSSGPDLLDSLFSGLSGSPQRLSTKLKLMRTLLTCLRTSDCPSTTAQSLVTVVLLELPRMPSDGVARLAEDCVDSITKNNDKHNTWKDLLPECLRLLSSEPGSVVRDGAEIACADFPSRCVAALCHFNWDLSCVTALAAMFREIQLGKEEHTLVVSKLTSAMDSLPPESLPPLLHQLLRLCKQQNAAMVYFAVSDYFTARLYPELLAAGNQDSESPDLDHEIVEAGGWASHATCILYLHGDQVLTILRPLARKPSSLLRAPTLLHVLLSYDRQRDGCIQLIKTFLLNNLAETSMRKGFTWCTDALPNPVDTQLLFRLLVDSSSEHCYRSVPGLLALFLSLLGTPAPLSTTARKALLRVISGDSAAAREAIRSLAAASLHVVPGVLEALDRRPTEASALLAACFEPGAPIAAAARVLRVLAPAHRDALFMLCRKGQFSGDPGVGRVAVCGLLCLLRTLPAGSLAAAIPDSSSDSQRHSALTQISIDVHSGQPGRSRVSNAAVCSEIVFLLRKCLGYSWEVREQLYLGLPDAVARKPELLDGVLEMLMDHLAVGFLAPTGAECPLVFDKCHVVRNGAVVLQEPIGTLLFCTVRMVQSASAEEIEDGGFVSKFASLLPDIARKMADRTAAAFNLDEALLHSEGTVEASSMMIETRQVMLTCEALMASCVTFDGGEPERVDVATLLGLHKTYGRLLDFTKAKSRGKKQTEKRKQRKDPDESDDKGKKKKTATVEVKQPGTVWNLTMIHSFLRILHSEGSWCSLEESNQIRSSVTLHRQMLVAAVAAIKSMDFNPSQDLDIITKIAALLYQRCLTRLEDFSTFDQECAQLAIELIQEIFRLVSDCEEFQDFIAQLDPEAPSSLRSILETVSSSISSFIEGGLPAALLKLHSALLDKLPQETQLFDKWTEWLTQLCSDNPPWLGSSAVGPLLAAAARSGEPWRAQDAIMGALAGLLGRTDSDEQTTPDPDYPGLAGPATLTAVLVHLTHRLAAVELLLARLRAELTALHSKRSPSDHPGWSSVRSRFVSLCAEFSHCCTAWRQLASLRVAAGPASWGALRLLTRAHAALASAAALHLMQRAPSPLQTRFDRVVKVAGRPLSKAVDCLIEHAESVRNLDSNPGVNKRRVQQDTKNIPRLVYQLELFCKRVVQLSTRTKVDLVCHLSVGSARDFRIKASAVREALMKEESNESNSDGEASNAQMEMEENSAESSSEECSQPKKKKKRTRQPSE